MCIMLAFVLLINTASTGCAWLVTLPAFAGMMPSGRGKYIYSGRTVQWFKGRSLCTDRRESSEDLAKERITCGGFNCRWLSFSLLATVLFVQAQQRVQARAGEYTSECFDRRSKRQLPLICLEYQGGHFVDTGP